MTASISKNGRMLLDMLANYKLLCLHRESTEHSRVRSSLQLLLHPQHAQNYGCDGTLADAILGESNGGRDENRNSIDGR